MAIVDLLGRARKIAEAQEFIANMPIEPSSVVRETLQKHFPIERKGSLTNGNLLLVRKLNTNQVGTKRIHISVERRNLLRLHAKYRRESFMS